MGERKERRDMVSKRDWPERTAPKTPRMGTLRKGNRTLSSWRVGGFLEGHWFPTLLTINARGLTSVASVNLKIWVP